ncbi:sulfotransferase [Aerosakkonema sp. BLCC-F183]|uniref:sulfotransferase family protein n=1 Tax=Aerosakkonema sp. BLCC-F183 TaxID=3342834 RepID=UPI0035B96C68
MMKIDSKERKPDFLIIGTQRGGTTSMYGYINQHPQVVPAQRKEVHFFDFNFHKGADWYREQFAKFAKSVDRKTAQQDVVEVEKAENNFINGFITGEASPYYLFHPLVPQRVYDLFPEIKLIVLLRNPVARVISHYYHEVKLGFENLSLEDAIAEEEFRLKGELEKILSRETYYSFNHQHYTYLSRGIYIEQIANWMSFFPKEQFLILKSEDFYNDPQAILHQVFEFLSLRPHKLNKYDKWNTADYDIEDVSEATHHQLKQYFQPYNRKLSEYLGRNFDWDRTYAKKPGFSEKW